MKINGYQNYEVRPNGEVININTGKVLKQCKDDGGYLIVNLYRNKKRKTYKVHRLVAEAFIPNPNNLPQVNHIDEDKTNNCINNLEWCTAKYNNNYGTRTEKTRKTVLQLRMDGSIVRVWSSLIKIKKEFDFNISHISECCTGKRHSAYGYKWCYTS